MPSRPEDLIRRLARRFGLVLAVVAGLMLLDQAVLQPLLVQLNSSAPVINLAGRQRMYSQRIVKDSLAIAIVPSSASLHRDTLSKTLADWRRVHNGLQHGDTALKLTPAGDPVIAAALSAIDHEVHTLSTLVDRVLLQPDSAAELAPAMLSAERSYLPAMDHIVELYELDARAQIVRLRRTAIIGTALALTLMAGLYWLVLSPAVALIRLQVAELRRHEEELLTAKSLLETRVEERTRQLSQSLRSLEIAAEERTLSEQRTRLLQHQLAHAARRNSLGELATGIAHEINQPLGTIVNDSETLLILSQQPAPDQHAISRTARRLRDAAQRAGLIVRRMRNFLRTRSAPQTPEFINPLIVEVIALCEPDLRERQVQIVVDTSATEALQLPLDAIQIQQVLVNLLRNSAQALEAVPWRPTIRISTRLEDDSLEIAVDDNGPGFTTIPDSDALPFDSTKPDGMGLGLSISRSIVEAHGGTLTTLNLDSGGARVVIVLPCPESHPLVEQPLELADSLRCG